MIGEAFVSSSDTIDVELVIECAEPMTCALEIRLYDFSGAPVGFASAGRWSPSDKLQFQTGQTKVAYCFDAFNLGRGMYRMQIALADPGIEYLDILPVELTVEFGGYVKENESDGLNQSTGHGAVRFDLKPKAISIR
jgi:hypothetical protein